MAMRVLDLFKFVWERHKIYLRRSAGTNKPWTGDEILQSFRFCNVYRELDTVTQWIAKNWRDPFTEDKNIWFAMVAARLINWPDSLASIHEALFDDHKKAVRWKAEWFTEELDNRKRNGEKVFTGAYMIHADATPTSSKAGYLAERVLTPMWERRKEVTAAFSGGSLARAHERLMQFRDMGSFMAAQVIADTKYTALLEGAEDWWTWAAPGPGSMRGLNRVMGHDPKESWKPELWLTTLQTLQLELNPRLAKVGMERLHAQDVQNCLCEYDKYMRVKLGEGRPRSLYPGV